MSFIIKMASKTALRSIRSAASFSRTRLAECGRPSACTSKRAYHFAAIPALTTSPTIHRPQLQQSAQTTFKLPASPRRDIFIQTQTTPNADVSDLQADPRSTAKNWCKALKFLPNSSVLPAEFPSTFVEYTSPRSTLAPPYPSPLAAKLLSVDGVSSIFYGADFITVTKAADANWAHIKPEVFSLITEAVASGEPMVNTAEKTSTGQGQEASREDTLGARDDDSEVVLMIKELLETRIRPAIQEDGGDIEFRGFEDGMVLLKLRGACRTCDSSTVTLKNGIENMLMHYVSSLDGLHSPVAMLTYTD